MALKFISWIKSYSLVEWLIFGALIAFNSWWVLWKYSLDVLVCYLCVTVLFVIFAVERRFRINCFVIAFILFFYFCIIKMNAPHLSNYLIVLAFPIAMSINRKEARNLVNMLTSFLFISVAISLPFWLIHQYVYEFAPFEILDLSRFKGTDGTFYLNYLFFISPQDSETMRFYSLFDEPGVLGTLSAFILWANHYNIKDIRCVVIFIGAIFTFSLAFYLLSFVGIAAQSKFQIKAMIKYGCMLFLIIMLVNFLLGDNLAYQQSILYRLSYFDENGVDSRSSAQLEAAWNSFMSSNSLFFGLGTDATLLYRGQGTYKVFIMEYGIFGLFLILFAYSKIMPTKSYYSMLTLVLFVLSFLQRPNLFTVHDVLLFSCITSTFMIYEETSSERNAVISGD